jgi:DNA-binding NarL/FixJ family response regulator
MLRSIVESAVASQPDMRVVGNGEHGSLDEAIERNRADVLIANEQPDRPESWFHPFLIAHPTLKVFVLTQDGRNATLLQFRRDRIADASPTTLVDAIRSVLRRDGTDEDS